MFTDMVGYTALTQSNEALALEVLQRHNRLLRPFFPKFHGREVKSIGDSFLVEFDSALDALRCAVEIQQYLHDYNFSSKEEWKIGLRIGIHLGDVIHQDGDVFGDAVNIASRIEPLAAPEGVVVSEQVYDQVQNKSELQLISLGEKSLKNVSRRIGVYALRMPWEGEVAEPSPRLDSKRIAVLPFVSLSPDPNDEYFADGLTEELITRVSLVKGLEVIARTSAMNYKKKEKNVSQIGRELKVGTVLEGSVRKAGNKIRISAQLIDSTTEGHLWAENYDRRMEDIFSIQSEIAENVASALKIRLLDEEKQEMRRPATVDLVAHDFYLKGRFHARRMTEEEFMTALGYFERAIERDPSFALAYTAMASVYNYLGLFEIMPSKDAFARAEELTRKALELNDSLAEAHLSMARVLDSVWNFAGAFKEAQRALALNANLAEAHNSLGVLYGFAWQFDKGSAEIERALELDPLSPSTMQFAATWYLYTGNPDKGAELYQKVLEIDPLDSFSRGNLGLCYVKKGMYDVGIGEIKKAKEMSKTLDPSRLSDLTYALAKAGRIDEARAVIPQLTQHYEEHRSGAGALAFAYASVGNREKAFEWLDRAYNEHSGYLRNVSLDFAFEDFHSDPKFLAFLERMRGSPLELRSEGELRF
jgi:TolB-like protein/Tfp pilus assembly protein PilF